MLQNYQILPLKKNEGGGGVRGHLSFQVSRASVGMKYALSPHHPPCEGGVCAKWSFLWWWRKKSLIVSGGIKKKKRNHSVHPGFSHTCFSSSSMFFFFLLFLFLSSTFFLSYSSFFLLLLSFSFLYFSPLLLFPFPFSNFHSYQNINPS